jgi:hypothetical protein
MCLSKYEFPKVKNKTLIQIYSEHFMKERKEWQNLLRRQKQRVVYISQSKKNPEQKIIK